MRGKREMPRKRHPVRTLLCVTAVAAVAVGVFLVKRPSAVPEDLFAEKETAVLPGSEREESAGNEADVLPEQALPAPAQNRFVLSFLGDCTLSSSHYTGHFEHVVGEDLAYPFSNVAEILLADDLTLANLECSFSDRRLESDAEYAFCGQPRYAESLTLGGVDCVSMGNNHTNDFGKAGVEDTKAVLDEVGIPGIGEGQGHCFDLRHEDGTSVRVGIFVRSMTGRIEQIRQGVESLREEGADIVIVCMHAGAERIYVPTDNQMALGRAAIRAGADLVVGTHPHVLQPVEEYRNGVILYSLGNFCFGGNRGPNDMDTVIAQMILQVEEDGVSWKMEYIPCSISSVPKVNDYRPTPYEEGSAGYERCLEKLNTPWDLTTAEEAAAKAAQEAADAAGNTETQPPEQQESVTDMPPEPTEYAGGPVFVQVMEEEPF